jgi:uncharacterized protein
MHTPPDDVEWDARKAAANLRKHRVSFVDAEQALRDPLRFTFEDADAQGEVRYGTIGCDSAGRLLVVIHVSRGPRVRIVSARRASRGEAVGYGLLGSGG